MVRRIVLVIAVAAGILTAAAAAPAPPAAVAVAPPPVTAGTMDVAKPYVAATYRAHNVALNTYRTFIWDGCRQQMRMGNFNSSGYSQMAYRDGTCHISGVSNHTLRNGAPLSNPVFSNRMCAAGAGSTAYCIQLDDGSLWLQYSTAGPIIDSSVIVCGQHQADIGCAEFIDDPFPG